MAKFWERVRARFLVQPQATAAGVPSPQVAQVPKVAELTPKVSELAWAFPSLVYQLADFPRYNPDELIGRKGYAIYKKMMLDEQVKAAVWFRRGAITSRDWYFELKDTKLSDDEVERRVAIMTKAVQQLRGSFSDALNGVMSAIYNGFSITEPVWVPFDYDGKMYWGLGALKLKPFDTFYFTPDEYGNVVRFEQWASGRRQPLNLDDFVHFVINPDVDEHYGQSSLREAYRAYFSKDMVIKFRNIWLERHAGGARWVQTTKEGGGAALLPNSPEYTALQDILTNFQTSTGAIIPRGLELLMQYPANQVAYKEAIDDYDLQIARSQLIPNLMGVTPTGQTGSYSQSDTQLEAFFWTLDADAERLEDCLNEQLFYKFARINFGDDDAPCFKFKPVSDRKMMEIIKTWRELVGAKAVRATESDEMHVRELLGFPEPTAPINQPEVIDANGNPVRRDAQGKPILDEDPGGGDDAGAAAGGGKSGKPGEDDGAGRGKGGGGRDRPNETVAGRDKVRVDRTAKLRALRRVDFAVIKRRSDDVVAEAAPRLGKIMWELTRDVFLTIDANNLVSEGKEDQVAKLKLDGKLKSKLQRAVAAALKDAWNVGLKHAATEIDKAKGEHLSRTVDGERVTLIGAEYFDAKSFTITGKLTDDALSAIKTIILNGVKNGRTAKQVKDEIVDRFSLDGVLSREEVLGYFGEAVDYANPEARLETIIRTTSTEAINEARYAYFTDPALGDFVEALEYSAINDDRTTEICSQLDGHVHPADDAFWNTYTPPNHFNCRSLIVPVTRRDTWTETDDPVTVEPQKGFG